MLQTGELGCRFEAELVDQGLPQPLIGLQGLGLSAAAIERQHELAPERLLHGMLGDCRLGQADDVVMVAELELGREECLDRRRP